jgi:hypothetical protein
MVQSSTFLSQKSSRENKVKKAVTDCECKVAVNIIKNIVKNKLKLALKKIYYRVYFSKISYKLLTIKNKRNIERSFLQIKKYTQQQHLTQLQ